MYLNVWVYNFSLVQFRVCGLAALISFTKNKCKKKLPDFHKNCETCLFVCQPADRTLLSHRKLLRHTHHLLTPLSIFPLIKAFGQPASVKGHHGLANCLIKKFGGGLGAPSRAQVRAGVDRAPRLRVPEVVTSRDQLLLETLTPTSDPVYLHPVQAGKRKNTVPLCLLCWTEVKKEFIERNIRELNFIT